MLGIPFFAQVPFFLAGKRRLQINNCR